jgi:predicted nucleic-acid-binding Zn-ribbon protein
MTDLPACPKCKGTMEQGFILDHTYGARLISYWAAGSPEKSIWTGTKLPKQKLIPVGTFRCANCGYLESYAHADYAAQ